MIKINSIQKGIEELMATETKGKKPIELTKIKNRLKFLKLVYAYLSENPSEEFVQKEYDRISSRIQKLKDGFEHYINLKCNTLKEKWDTYRSENDMKKLETQLKTLSYILEK